MAGEGRQIGSNFHGRRWRFQPEIELGAAIGQFPQQTVDREFRLAGPGGDRVQNQLGRAPQKDRSAARPLGAAAASMKSFFRSASKKSGNS